MNNMGPKQRYAEVIGPKDLMTRRLKLGLSLRELAKRIDRPASFTFIGRLERGVTKTLTPELAYALLTALEIEPEQMHFYFRFHGIAGSTFHRAAA